MTHDYGQSARLRDLIIAPDAKFPLSKFDGQPAQASSSRGMALAWCALAGVVAGVAFFAVAFGF